MPTHLCLTFRFLQPFSHGRGDGGEPEWPPSPLRAFQALVAAAAAKWDERVQVPYAAPALRWLEERSPPEIVADAGVTSGTPYRLYVPDNVADRVARAWSGGRDDSIANYRTEKDVRPVHLQGGATVRYLYPLGPDADGHIGTLAAAARAVTHLGWGIDMVAADAGELADADAAALPGERWRPTPGATTGLRVPVEGTLAALGEKHAAFLNRLSADGFTPVPPLARFDVVGYARPGEQPRRPFAAFQLLDPEGQDQRSFDTVGRFAHVAGMVRNAARKAALEAGWPADRVESFVCGHGAGKNGQATTDDRLLYLPLPSITPVGVERVRRVLVAGPPGADVTDVRRLLNGRELVPDGDDRPVAVLALIPGSDKVVGRYVRASRAWSTVTPVALPGYADPDGIRKRLASRDPARQLTADQKRTHVAALDRRILDLLRKALGHAGLPADVVAAADIAYRGSGFRPGVKLAHEYVLPPIDYPRYHVRVRFAAPVPGPLAVGAGRYRGLGLFAADD